MSVLIKGVEMPSGCASCPLANMGTDTPFCWQLMQNITRVSTRLADCPLVEVPTPHGNLIDQDACRDDFVSEVYNACADDPDNYRANSIIDAFDLLPTVIEAEE